MSDRDTQQDRSIVAGVQQALDREPKDFADYARETAATGVWDAKGGEPTG